MKTSPAKRERSPRAARRVSVYAGWHDPRFAPASSASGGGEEQCGQIATICYSKLNQLLTSLRNSNDPVAITCPNPGGSVATAALLRLPGVYALASSHTAMSRACWCPPR